MQFTLDGDAVRDFSRANRDAMLMMYRGTDDYVGARCCLLNGVFSGLELGAQAFEKHVKAMLLFVNPNAKVKRIRHGLSELLSKIRDEKIADLSHHVDVVRALEAHYQARYPDNPGKGRSASTGELESIDVLMNDVLSAMPIPEEVMLRSGVFARVVAASEGSKALHSDGLWLLKGNLPLQKKLAVLVERNEAWLKYAHPTLR